MRTRKEGSGNSSGRRFGRRSCLRRGDGQEARINPSLAPYQNSYFIISINDKEIFVKMADSPLVYLRYGGNFEVKEALIKYLITMKAELEVIRKTKITRKGLNKHQYTTLSEYYSFCLYLMTLASHDLLQYPFTFEKSERPDFIINQYVGVEIAKATKEKLQEQYTLREDGPAPFIFRNNQGVPFSKSSKGVIGLIDLEEPLSLASKTLKKHSENIDAYKKKHKLLEVDFLCHLETEEILDEEELRAPFSDMIWNTSHLFRRVAVIARVTLYGLAVILVDKSSSQILRVSFNS